MKSFPGVINPSRPNFESCANASSDEDDSISNASTSTVKNDIDEVEDGEIVVITHVEDTIFVRPVKFDQQFDKLMEKINSDADILRPVVMPLQENENVLVKFCGDYTRAVIIDPTKITVQLIDFGLTKDVVDCAKFRSISPDLIYVRRMALPIRLKFPENLSEDEKSAVVTYLQKWKNNKFIAQTVSPFLGPISYVDLVHITSGRSLTNDCLNECVRKRMTMEDIPKKRISGSNVTLCIIDTENRPNFFISCVLIEDVTLFAKRFAELSEFGCTLIKNEPYMPEKLELCFVMHKDEGTPFWYRGQFHQLLTDDRVQVGLVDFGCSVVVPLSNIRKFDHNFAYECVSVVCKMRNQEIDMGLLDLNDIVNYNFIHATQIQPAGNFHEIFLSNEHFLQDENYEEAILALED